MKKALERELNLLDPVHRRELIARADILLISLPELEANKLNWLVQSCRELPNHQDNWIGLSDALSAIRKKRTREFKWMNLPRKKQQSKPSLP